jgi:hypothetical protein
MLRAFGIHHAEREAVERVVETQPALANQFRPAVIYVGERSVTTRRRAI